MTDKIKLKMTHFRLSLVNFQLRYKNRKDLFEAGNISKEHHHRRTDRPKKERQAPKRWLHKRERGGRGETTEIAKEAEEDPEDDLTETL